MRRFLFPMALWVYVCTDRALQGAGVALYFGQGWEMCFVWLVALLFVGIVGRIIWQDAGQRALILAPPTLPTGKELAWNLFLLSLFTWFLVLGMGAIHQWWEAAWVDMWFKVVFCLFHVVFWGIAGHWWRDTIQVLVQIEKQNLKQLRRKHNR